MAIQERDCFLDDLVIHNDRSEFDEKKELVRAYYESLVAALNMESSQLGNIVSFQSPSDDVLSNLVGGIPSAKKFQKDFERIFPEQVATAFEVMHSLIVNDLSHEHVTGLTQIGKSGLITVLMDFVGIVSYAHSEKSKVLLPVAWLPNAINMEKQSIRKMSQSSFLNGHISVLVGDREVRLGRFNETVNQRLARRVAENIGRKAQQGLITARQKTTQLGEISEFFGSADSRSALVLRRSRVSDKKYKWLFQAASESSSIEGFAEVNIALLMDESHIAIGKGQGGDRILGLNTGESEEEYQSSQYSEDDDDEFDGEEPGDSPAAMEDVRASKEACKDGCGVLNTYSLIFENRAKFVSVSATNTPWNLINYEKGRDPVYLKLGQGYCGFPFVDGKDYPLDPGVSVVEPIVKPIRDFEDLVPDIKHLNLRHLDSVVSYAQSLVSEDWRAISDILNTNMPLLAAKLRDPVRKNLRTIEDNGHSRNRAAKILDVILNSKSREWMELGRAIKEACQLSQYLSESEFKSLFTISTAKSRKAKLIRLCGEEKSLKRAWEQSYIKAQDALAALFKYLLLDVNPQNKRGCILRWECKNETFDHFIKPLESKFGNRLRFIPYMGSNASQPVSELLESVNRDNRPYVIVVTGRGRYGESYPSDCGYAIDGTTKNASAAAFLQSLLGRISGYNKYDPDDPDGTKPMLILSDLAYDQVFLELKRGKGYSPRVGTGANLVKTGLDFKPIEQIIIMRNPHTLDLEVLFQKLDDELATYRAKLSPDEKEPIRRISMLNQSDLFALIEPIASYAEHDSGTVLQQVRLPDPKDALPELRILRPGCRVNDERGRMLDWHGRTEEQTVPPDDSHPFVAFEQFRHGRKKFGLTSARNNDGAIEYLHTGLQLEEGTLKAMAVWMWLENPIYATVTGPHNGALKNRQGSMAHTMSMGSMGSAHQVCVT
jgi:hypothetical protein